MCGIVGAIAQRDVAEILLEGLRRLETADMTLPVWPWWMQKVI
ncbi:glucosamine--fructose-6-phosphate aminotransferase [Salmonella enterica subsp. enterica serovar Typhimurium str. DT104]|nr:glucosamine--fructose-6-phosphate aminotransferase [Salmonella enterica subsp. enterica serovar Typhimurium str. DT104]